MTIAQKSVSPTARKSPTNQPWTLSISKKMTFATLITFSGAVSQFGYVMFDQTYHMVMGYFRIAMDLWLSTSTLDTWVHGQSMIHGTPEFTLSTLNVNFLGPVSSDRYINLWDGEAMMEADLSQRICQDMVFRFHT